MSIYAFSPLSPVRDIRFRYAVDRPPIALISAGVSSQAQLAPIRRMLEAEDFSCVPVAVDGKPVLQVEGFKDEGQLSGLLTGHHFVQGAPRITPEPGDRPTRSWDEWLKDKSLETCGWSYIVGDVALLASGLMSGRNKEALSGALYTAGGLVLAGYGNVKTEHHLRRVAERTAQQLKQQAGGLPEECGLFTILKEKRHGVLPHIDDLLTRYPSQTTLSIYAMGALAMLQSGLKHNKSWDVFYGATVGAAGIGSIIIPEKRKDEKHDEKPPTDLFGRLWSWIEEKPLRMAGYAYIVGGLALGMSAYREYLENPRQKSYIAKFITTGTYLFGDVLIALSNKDHTNAGGTFDAEEQRRITALAAEGIASYPKEMRAGLVHQMAGFLSTQPEMQGKAADIAAAIGEQVAHMEKNPWACRADAKMRGHTASSL